MQLILEENEVDYYTDVYVQLVFNGNVITLLKDNLLTLKNSMEQISKDIKVLDPKWDETRLGILLNDYYRGIYENEIANGIQLDPQGIWTVEKYCWFMSSEYATWIYQYCGMIIMKVTPVFCGFEEEDYVQEYCKFQREYKDVFREPVSLQQLTFMKQLIFNLHDTLLQLG